MIEIFQKHRQCMDFREWNAGTNKPWVVLPFLLGRHRRDIACWRTATAREILAIWLGVLLVLPAKSPIWSTTSTSKTMSGTLLGLKWESLRKRLWVRKRFASPQTHLLRTTSRICYKYAKQDPEKQVGQRAKKTHKTCQEPPWKFGDRRSTYKTKGEHRWILNACTRVFWRGRNWWGGRQ